MRISLDRAEGVLVLGQPVYNAINVWVALIQISQASEKSYTKLKIVPTMRSAPSEESSWRSLLEKKGLPLPAKKIQQLSIFIKISFTMLIGPIMVRFDKETCYNIIRSWY